MYFVSEIERIVDFYTKTTVNPRISPYLRISSTPISPHEGLFGGSTIVE